MFVRAKNYELNDKAAILVISPLKSIIEDQLQEMELLGYMHPAKDLANLSNDDIRGCNLAIKEGGFTSCQLKMLLIPIKLFLSAGLIMLWKVLHLYWENVILAACLTLSGHDIHIDWL